MKIVVTSALPYANGPIHIGHLVEYIQTDIFVRFLKSKGINAIYCCADDTHGTPIEINAKKMGISPEKLVEKYYKEHVEAFKLFDVNFDNFYTTNSPENKYFSDYFFTKLKENGDIYEKEVELTYCESCERFLPDRYVKGTCPKCGAEEQYGDNCEKCNATYEPTDLNNSKCIICESSPIRKKSKHYFFKLTNYSEKLKKWLIENPNLQDEVKNYVLNWIKEGLKDWDITRDAPYFGFKIVGEEDKYYYVWLDAPIGYIASCKNYCDKHGLNYEDYWKSENGRIIHFIGKDIIYFHFLFWPAMLMGVGFNLPYNIIVHGFLTINGEKMSKSRGTFITAIDCAKKINPQYLRYYYASILSKSLKDIDLDTEELKNKINSELIDNFGNLANRSFTFLYKHFNGELNSFSFPDQEKQITDLIKKTEKYFNEVEYNHAIRNIMEIGFIGNKFFQDMAPWSLIKENKQKAQEVLSFSVNVVKIMGTLLKPIIPAIIKKLENILNIELSFEKTLNFNLYKHTINKPKILMKKIEKLELFEKDPIESICFKVGEIISVKDHPEADKLYILEVNFGNEIKQIVSGIKDSYNKEDLQNKKAVFVYNLKPVKLRGIQSSGMILAVSNNQLCSIILSDGEVGEIVTPENLNYDGTKEINIKHFSKIKLYCDGEKVTYNNLILKTNNTSQQIFPDKNLKGVVK